LGSGKSSTHRDSDAADAGFTVSGFELASDSEDMADSGLLVKCHGQPENPPASRNQLS
jgi:hypothetical protein